MTGSVVAAQVEYSIKALIHIVATGSLEVSQALLRKGLTERINAGWNVLVIYDQFRIFKELMSSNELINAAFIKDGQIISEFIHGLYRRDDTQILYVSFTSENLFMYKRLLVNTFNNNLCLCHSSIECSCRSY